MPRCTSLRNKFLCNSAYWLLLSITLVIMPSFANAATKVMQIITLENRPSEDILASIKTHLPKGTQASKQGQQIILSGTTQQVTQLQELIKQLDIPLQTWRVLFAQSSINMQEKQQANTRSYSTRKVETSALLVSEGASAKFEQGFWVPVDINSGQQRSRGYEWLAGGIWVSITPLGDELRVHFSSHNLTKQPNTLARSPSFTGQGIESHLNLQLGNWVTLGSESQLAELIPDPKRRYTGGSKNDFYSLCVETIEQATCPR